MNRFLAIAGVAIASLALSACDLAPKTSAQYGYRGTGMDSIKVKAKPADADVVPPPPYETPSTEGPRAGAAYQNVQVLGDVSEEQFTYTMAALTQWVSPEQGCNYCHNPANMASDELYTKVVARKMLQMTRNLNQNWSKHVAKTGVTCWTCHRGQPVPTNYWTMPGGAKNGIAGNLHGQNSPIPASAYASLPNASLASYLTGDPKIDESIRVNSTGMHPTDANKTSTMDTEKSYALMMHVSKALGVNCTFCHNSDSFQSWSNSTPQRVTAWYGVRMVRDVNSNYISSLAGVFPAKRKGPEGDPFKVNCTTCHQGKNKPMGGYQMAKDYPALWGPSAASVPAVATQPAAAPAPAVTAQ